MEEAPCPDCLVWIEVVFLSEPCEWEFVLVAGYPAVEGSYWYFGFVFSAHGSSGHIKGMALVVVC